MQAIELIEDFFFHMHQAHGTERVCSGNLLSGCASGTPNSDPQVHSGATVSDFQDCIADDLFSSTSDTSGATTLVVRNIPKSYTKEVLLQEFPPDGTYDFFHLPFNFKHRKIAGYLFLNFKSNAAASAFRAQWHGRSLDAQGSSAKLNIALAEVQGLDDNVHELIKRQIQKIKNPQFLPSVFDGLVEIPFSEFVKQKKQNRWVSTTFQH